MNLKFLENEINWIKHIFCFNLYIFLMYLFINVFKKFEKKRNLLKFHSLKNSLFLFNFKMVFHKKIDLK